MHHRQLQVRGRVVDREPPGLGDRRPAPSATAASRLAGEITRARVVQGRGDDRGEVRRPDRHRQREDRDQQGGLDQRQDGHLPAGAHAAERGPGVERRPAPASRCPARAARPRRTGPAARPSADAVVTNGTTAATATVVASSTQRRDPEQLAGPVGVIGSLRSSLRRSRHGCSTPGPARPSSRARTWRITPTSSGAPPATRATWRTPPVTPSAAHRVTASTISSASDRVEAVAEVAVDAAVGASRRPASPHAPHRGEDRPVEAVLDPVGDPPPVARPRRPGSATRREWVTSTSVSGAQHVVEHPLQRLGERRGGVLHARGERARSAVPQPRRTPGPVPGRRAAAQRRDAPSSRPAARAASSSGGQARPRCPAAAAVTTPADTGSVAPSTRPRAPADRGQHQRRAPAPARRRPPRPAPIPASMVAVSSPARRAACVAARPARNPTPNAFTNVATASPAVSATAATASGSMTAVADAAARAARGRAPAAAATRETNAGAGRQRRARRARPSPNAAVVHRHAGAQPAERVQVTGAGARAAPSRPPGTAAS